MKTSNFGTLVPALGFAAAAALGCSAEAGFDEGQAGDDETYAEGSTDDTLAFDELDPTTDTGDDAADGAIVEEVALPELAASGPGRDVSGLTLAPTWTEYSLGRIGGSGGSYTGHVGSGVIYGVQINSGAYVDRISFAYYLPSNGDNRFRSGDFVGSTSALGGGGGSSSPWVYCPGGQGVIGIRGSAGSYVDRVGIICSDVTRPDPYSSGNFMSGLYGGGGGSWFDSRCSAGYLLDAFNVRSGSFVDQLQGICIAAR